MLEIGGRTLPWGGGAYFRLIPYPIFRAGLRKIQNNGDGYYVFYLHPWELDPNQPRVKGIKYNYRLRHYFGLSRTEEKLKRLLADFAFGPIRSVRREEGERNSVRRKAIGKGQKRALIAPWKLCES